VEDAVRLEALQKELSHREVAAKQDIRRQVVARLRELYLPVPRRVAWWLRED
jgi:hypothetical protein